MTPGPTLILQCPESDKLIKGSTLASGNTFGGKRWSDGYALYPMLPSTPQITRCDAQGKFFWVAEATVVGKLGPGIETTSIPQAWREADHLRFLSEQEYLAALAEGLGRNRKEEVYLRVQAWWAANSAVRNAGTEGAITSPFFPGSRARDNLERLIELLATDDPPERLMKAEALRQLGRFEEARQILQATVPEQLEEVVRWLRELVDKGDVLVKEMPAFRK